VKRLLRYDRGSVDEGVVYEKCATGILHGLSDAYWENVYERRRSATGIMFMLGGTAASWALKKQKTVALSAMEAEYMALCEARKEAIWLNRLIQGVILLVTQLDKLLGPVNIRVYNSSCIDCSKNPVELKRIKHICSGSFPQSQRGITPSENPAQDADRYARVTTRTPGSLGAKRTKIYPQKQDAGRAQSRPPGATMGGPVPNGPRSQARASSGPCPASLTALPLEGDPRPSRAEAGKSLRLPRFQDLLKTKTSGLIPRFFNDPG